MRVLLEGHEIRIIADTDELEEMKNLFEDADANQPGIEARVVGGLYVVVEKEEATLGGGPRRYKEPDPNFDQIAQTTLDTYGKIGITKEILAHELAEAYQAGRDHGRGAVAGEDPDPDDEIEVERVLMSDGKLKDFPPNIDARIRARHFQCCGGNDESPPEHTQDCPDREKKIENGPYVTLEVWDDGDLDIKLTDNGVRYIEENRLLKPEGGINEKFVNLLDGPGGVGPLQNGWYYLPPEAVGALTSSPILCNDAEYLGDHKWKVNPNRVWWYPAYEVKNEILELYANGFIRFQKAPSNELLDPEVNAEVHSDDHVEQAEFEATQWFALANDDELRALIKCDFRGDYPADAVAEFFRGKDDAVDEVFTYLEVSNKGRRDPLGFECVVDEGEARAWIEKHRPHLVTWPDPASDGGIAQRELAQGAYDLEATGAFQPDPAKSLGPMDPFALKEHLERHAAKQQGPGYSVEVCSNHGDGFAATEDGYALHSFEAAERIARQYLGVDGIHCVEVVSPDGKRTKIEG